MKIKSYNAYKYHSAELEMTYYVLATMAGIQMSDEWTGMVETTIIDHLKAWGEWEEDE